jgi:hypothetical protein
VYTSLSRVLTYEELVSSDCFLPLQILSFSKLTRHMLVRVVGLHGTGVPNPLYMQGLGLGNGDTFLIATPLRLFVAKEPLRKVILDREKNHLAAFAAAHAGAAAAAGPQQQAQLPPPPAQSNEAWLSTIHNAVNSVSGPKFEHWSNYTVLCRSSINPFAMARGGFPTLFAMTAPPNGELDFAHCALTKPKMLNMEGATRQANRLYSYATDTEQTFRAPENRFSVANITVFFGGEQSVGPLVTFFEKFAVARPGYSTHTFPLGLPTFQKNVVFLFQRHGLEELATLYDQYIADVILV